jgi:hypothetical protein
MKATEISLPSYQDTGSMQAVTFGGLTVTVLLTTVSCQSGG